MDTDKKWYEYRGKSGEVLYYHNIITEEYRYPRGNCKTCSSTDNSHQSCPSKSESGKCIDQSIEQRKRLVVLLEKVKVPVKKTKRAEKRKLLTNSDDRSSSKSSPENTKRIDEDSHQLSSKLPSRSLDFTKSSKSLSFKSSESSLQALLPGRSSPVAQAPSEILHDDPSYECDKCNKVFTIKDFLVKHRKTHIQLTGTRRFGCATCKRMFKTKHDLVKHIATHTYRARLYECDYCGMTFMEYVHLCSHKKVHSEDKPYKCKHCSKEFRHNSALTVHIRTIHEKLKPYKCKVCGKCFAQRGTLTGHLKTHTKQTPYECTICGKKLSCKGSLNYHMKSHSKDKQYKCETCGKAFIVLTSLRYHEMTHTGNHPFRCEKCGKGFVSKEKLRRHMRVHAEEEEAPFECSVCGQEFNTRPWRRRHLREVHDIDIEKV